jgi:hypothetical protein
MKIVPVVCFALATAAASSMLPVASSYAQTYSNPVQNCASTGPSTEGVGNCLKNRIGISVGDHNGAASHNQSRAAGSHGRGK